LTTCLQYVLIQFRSGVIGAHRLTIRLSQLPVKSIKLRSSWRLNFFNKDERVIWYLTTAAVLWGIWTERNYRIINKHTRSPLQSFNVCMVLFSYWLNLLSDTSKSWRSELCSIHGREWSLTAFQRTHWVGEDMTATRITCDRWQLNLVIFFSFRCSACLGSKLYLIFISRW